MAAGETVLIVEDDEAVQQHLAQTLRGEGYTAVAVGTGGDGLEYLHQHLAPALIILDMMLPQTDGWLFLRRRAQQPGLAAIPVLILTALRVASPEWARDLGACGVLQKPFGEDEILREVQGCLAQRGR
jgi:CheY-like chemotaxis protein